MNVVDYTAPPTVDRFISHYLPGKYFENWIIGPVGSGKTTGIFFKLAFMASLQEPSPVDGVRRVRAVVVRNTMPQLKDTTLVSWDYWFKEGVAGDWNATDKVFTLKWGKGYGRVECEVLFRPLDTAADVARCLSLEVTFAIFDEFVEIPEEIIRAMRARCGRYPKKELYPDGEKRGATNWGMWGSSNPGNEDQFWYSYLGLELGSVLPTNRFYFEQPSGFADDAENLENLPGGRQYYVDLAEEEDDSGAKKDEAWVNRFINVRWGFSLSGKPVVSTFTIEIHVAKKVIKPLPGYPVVIGYDPGVGGSAMIFMQFDLNGRCLIIDELIQRGFGTSRLVTDRLNPLLTAKYNGYEILILPDPAANSRTQTDEKTSVDVIKGLAKSKSNPTLPARWRVVFPLMDNRLQHRLDAIEYYTTRITGMGPALIVSPHCKGFIRAYSGGWRYATDRKGKTADEPEKNEASHTGDAGGYGMIYGHKNSGHKSKRPVVQSSPYRNTYVAS